MEPMTPLDQLKGIQAKIAGLILDDPHAVEMAIQLGAAFEYRAGKIHQEADNARFDAIWNPMGEALMAEAAALDDALSMVRPPDVNTPAEDAATDELESRVSHVCPVFAPRGVK